MNIFKRFQKSAERLKSKPIEEFRKEDGQLNIDLTVFLQLFAEYVLVLCVLIALFASLIQEPADIILELHGTLPIASMFITAGILGFTGVSMVILHKLYYPRVREDIAEHPEMREEYVIGIAFGRIHLLWTVVLLFALGVLIGIAAPTDETQVMILEVSFLSAILPFFAAWSAEYALKIQHRKYVGVQG